MFSFLNQEKRKEHLFKLGMLLCLLAIFACDAQRSEQQYQPDGNRQASRNLEGTADSINVLIDTYEDPERSRWQNPDQIIRRLELDSGKVIADIGAGTGYFTFRLADRGAYVIAIDIEEQFLNYIRDRIEEYGSPYDSLISLQLTVPDNPMLKPLSVDAVLLVNTYIFLNNRNVYMKHIYNALKPGGKLLVVDFKKGDMQIGPANQLRIPPLQVMKTLEQEGFSDIELDSTTLTYQFIVEGYKSEEHELERRK